MRRRCRLSARPAPVNRASGFRGVPRGFDEILDRDGLVSRETQDVIGDEIELAGGDRGVGGDPALDLPGGRTEALPGCVGLFERFVLEADRSSLQPAEQAAA